MQSRPVPTLWDACEQALSLASFLLYILFLFAEVSLRQASPISPHQQAVLTGSPPLNPKTYTPASSLPSPYPA